MKNFQKKWSASRLCDAEKNSTSEGKNVDTKKPTFWLVFLFFQKPAFSRRAFTLQDSASPSGKFPFLQVLRIPRAPRKMIPEIHFPARQPAIPKRSSLFGFPLFPFNAFFFSQGKYGLRAHPSPSFMFLMRLLGIWIQEKIIRKKEKLILRKMIQGIDSFFGRAENKIK